MTDEATYQSPPTELHAGAPGLPPEDTAKWPKVIGIISLIYAIGGMLCGISYAVSTLLTKTLMAMGGMEGVDVAMPAKIVVFVLVFLNLILGIMLLTAAVQLLRRKRTGVSGHLRWALLRMILILFAAVSTLFTAKMSVEFEKARIEATNRMIVENGGEAKDIPTDESLHRRTIIMTAVFSGIQSIYPLFIGFYLSRRKIREQISHWPGK